MVVGATTDAVIHVADLSKRFGSQRAVDKVQFSVRRGEVFGLLGPNGAGKTTIIRMLTRLLRPTSGDITYHPRGIEERIAVVPDSCYLYAELSVRQNLEFLGTMLGLPRGERARRIADLGETCQVTRLLPRRVGELSFGQKKSVMIAASLLDAPAILFLDEPTAGLDVPAAHEVRQRLKALNRAGTTIVITTHNMAEAEQLCHRIGLMRGGQLLLVESPSRIKQLGGDLRTIEVQLREPARLAAAIPGLASAAAVEEVEWSLEKLAITTRDVGRLLPDLFGLLGAHPDWGVTSFSVLEPTLEQAFIRLVGADP